MARIEGMRLPAGLREALVDDPNFLRELVQVTLDRFLDAEIVAEPTGPFFGPVA